MICLLLESKCWSAYSGINLREFRLEALDENVTSDIRFGLRK